MKTNHTREQLESLLKWAIKFREDYNVVNSAPCRLTDMNYYKLGFKPSTEVRVTECIGYDATTEKWIYNHEDSIDACNMHEAYIKVLERKLERKEYTK